MNIKTNLKKIGTSHHFLIPSSIIQVYGLLNYIKDYEYSITIENNGKRIVLNRVKKNSSKSQTTLDKFEDKKK